MTRALLLVMLVAVGCARAPEVQSPLAVATPIATTITQFVRVEQTKMPPVARDRLSAERREAFEVAERLVGAGSVSYDGELSAMEARRWSALGWGPWQAARKAQYENAIALLTAAPTLGPDDSIFVVSVLTARMQESLAFDWETVHVMECTLDPLMCSAAHQMCATAQRIWLERARTNYQLCRDYAVRFDRGPDWKQHCTDRIVQIDFLMHRLNTGY